jgi:chaperonin GroES
MHFACCIVSFEKTLKQTVFVKNSGDSKVMKVKPLGNRVLVRRSTVKSTKGGILLPDTAQEKPKEGEVIAVGPGKMNDRGEIEQMNVKVGDRVIFGSYAGTEVKGMNDDKEYLLLGEDEILGIITEK